MINDSNDNRRYTISLIMVAVCLIYIIRLFSIQIVKKAGRWLKKYRTA